MIVRTVALAALVLGVLAACGDSGPPPQRVAGKTQKAWLKQLESSLPKEQAAAIEALAQFDSPPLETIAGLLDKRGRTVRLSAIRALGTIGPAAAEHAKRLAPLLEDDPKGDAARNARDFRNAAIVSLQKMGKGAFKPIAHLLVSEDPRHRLRAVFTLSAYAADLEHGTQTLLPLLEDQDVNVRREAARALGLAGKGDTRASEALLAVLADSEPRVVAAAAIALGGIGGRSDHEGQALADLLFKHQGEVRASAAYGLGLMGEEASPYLARLEDLMEHDGKRSVRVQAARAHFRIEGDATKVLPTLQAAVGGRDAGTCREAARALGEIGPAAAGAVADLEQAAERFASQQGVVRRIQEALTAIQGD